MSAPELSVVCKSCGSEVSPYVTECPYCGARLRKRAPKLQRQGEGLEPKQRRRRRPRLGRRLGEIDFGRPWATIAVIAASAAMLLIQRATAEPLYDLGGIAGPIDSDWWRYLTAPFVYVDVGYLFVVALALGLFASGIERRLGSIATLILLIACGALGMVVAEAIDPGSSFTRQLELSRSSDIPISFGLSGGNGIALGALGAWVAIRYAETRRAIDEEFDKVGVAVAAVVLLALPAFTDEASVWAGLAGGVVGIAAGSLAAALRPRR